MRWLAVLALAACGGSSPAPAEPIAGRASEPGTVPRPTPAPVIVWKDGAFVTDALPAVARHGEVTVLALRDNDGGRGYPNLAIEVRDRSDHSIKKLTVMVSNEYETLAPDGTPNDALRQRIEAANAELARLHGVHDLVPMKPLDLQKPADGSDEHLAIGDGIDVDWNKDHLHVFPHNVDRALATVDGRGWLVPDHKPCSGCDPCSNPAHLAGVFHAPGVNVIVADIAYHGTDTCWEPADELHVVAWW
jgi:hypothetical protein